MYYDHLWLLYVLLTFQPLGIIYVLKVRHLGPEQTVSDA